MITVSYDFESNTLDIVSADTNTTNKEIDNFYKYLKVDLCKQYPTSPYINEIMRRTSIMCVHGIDCADNEFTFITDTTFRNIVDTYISEFELQPENIQITSNSLVVNGFNVFSTNYTFTSDLCSFTLYHIYGK